MDVNIALKDRFSVLYNSVKQPRDIRWNEPLVLENSFEIENLFLDEIQEIFNSRVEIKEMKAIGESVLEDLIKIKSQLRNSKEIERINFLMLNICTGILKRYNSTGNFHYCFDLLMLTIQDKKMENGEEYSINSHRIFQYTDSLSEDIEITSRIRMIDWLGQFFYYSRSFSGLNDWGHYLIEEVMYLLDEEFLQVEEEAFFLSNVYSWCDLNKLRHKLAYLQKRYLKLIYSVNDLESSKYGQSLGVNIVMTRHYDFDKRKELAAKMVNVSWHNQITKIQFELFVYFDSINDKIRIENITRSIEILLAQIKQSNHVNYINEKARIAKIFNVVVKEAFTIDRYKDLTSIIGAYHEVSTLSSHNVLFVVPNHEKGVAYLSKDYMTIVNHDTYNLIQELTEIRNRVFNQTIILKGTPEQKMIPPSDIIGKPNFKLGIEYEKVLTSVYEFNNLKENLPAGVESIFQFDFGDLPIQSLMIKEVGFTFPRLTSFQKKNPTKITQSVLFWKGNSFTSSLEFEAVSSIFEMKGIDINCLSEGESSKEEFLTECKKGYDIIWISSHGGHEHYDPVRSSIMLDADNSINLSDYNELKSGEGEKNRRLIFFNVCEGGKSAQIGEMLNTGFPVLLTNSSDDLISHLWMINLHSARIYGVLFAYFIAKGQNFFDAYVNTVKSLQAGRDEIKSVLDLTTTEITDFKNSLDNLDSHDWGNILNWGSSAFYT